MRTSLILMAIALCVTGTVVAAQPDTDQAEKGGEESIEVQLARAQVELAEIDLQRAIECNKRMPNTFPPEVIDVFRLHVAADEAHLKQCLLGESADPQETTIRRAEVALHIAEANLARLKQIDERMPSAAHALDVKRAAVVARIAKLNLEDMKQLSSLETSDHLQRQIDELRHEVFLLRLRLATRP